MYERLKQDPGSLESIVNDTLSSLGSAASGIWKEVAAMLIGSDNSVADGGNSEVRVRVSACMSSFRGV